mgnify:CR=1 FL=1
MIVIFAFRCVFFFELCGEMLRVFSGELIFFRNYNCPSLQERQNFWCVVTRNNHDIMFPSQLSKWHATTSIILFRLNYRQLVTNASCYVCCACLLQECKFFLFPRNISVGTLARRLTDIGLTVDESFSISFPFPYPAFTTCDSMFTHMRTAVTRKRAGEQHTSDVDQL